VAAFGTRHRNRGPPPPAVRRHRNGAGAPLRLALDAWGANGDEGAGAGSRSQAGLGGENGRVALATPTPMPKVQRFQSHLFDGVCRTGRPGAVTPEINPKPVSSTDYAALSAGWGALLGAVLIAARDKGDEPVRPAEVLPLGLATFALSKLVSKEKVDAWVREPFIDERPEGREPKGTGLRYAVGELITCTRCVGVWSALGLTALRVTRPREARVVNAVLGASAVNDAAQAAFSWLCGHANAASAPRERRAEQPRFSRAPAG
jgi:Protein of unknown function (DUF1360)